MAGGTAEGTGPAAGRTPAAGPARETSGATTRLIVEYVRSRAGPAGVRDLLERAGLPYGEAELTDEDRWFSFADKVALFEAAGAVLGDPCIGRRVGEAALDQQVGVRQKLLFRAVGSPRRLLLAAPRVAPRLSTALAMWARPDGPGAVLVGYRVTGGNTAHRADCDYNIGLLSQAGPLFGLPPLHVEHRACQVDGAPECVYRVSWRPRSFRPAGWLRRWRTAHRGRVRVMTEQLDALRRTTADLVSDAGIDTVLDRIAVRATGAVQAHRWILVVRSGPAGEVRVRHQGLSEAEVAALAEALSAEHLDHDDPTMLVVDIASATRHHGRLAVVYDEAPFMPTERDLLRVYAHYAAAALDAATALDEARRQGRTATRLLHLAHRLAGARSSLEVAETLARAASDVVDADSAAVLLWDHDDETLRIRGAHGVTPDLEPLIDSLQVRPSDAGVVAQFLEDRRPRVFSRGSVQTDFGRWLLDETRAEMLAVFPLQAHDVFYGVVATRWATGSSVVDGEDLHARLSGLADQGATALENAVLLERVHHQALHDPLTGLANRELFGDRVDQAVRRARREGGALAVLYVDLDRFKKVNDELGHEVGNRVLCEVAARLRACLRDEDTVARMGGDEFTVLLPGADATAAEVVARAVFAACGRPHRVDGEEFVVTASVGVAAFPDHGLTAEALVANADHAMYRVKARGRNGYQVSDGRPTRSADGSLSVERDLRAAVEQGALEVAYQPIVDLRTGQVRGVEALARWPHPRLGELGPDRFVHLAEDIGLIGWVDRLILDRACAQAAAWLADGLDLVTVSVNLSAQTLEQPRFVEEVARVLARHRLAPERLGIEITESVAVGDAAAERSAVAALEALGVSVAIDDFGTRYAILGRLRHLPVDTLKIDRSFVAEITGRTTEVPIVSAIVAMGRSLGLRVVAEGVETPVQVDVLRRLGCDLAQGFLFSRPRPAEAVAPLLRRRFSVARAGPGGG